MPRCRAQLAAISLLMVLLCASPAAAQHVRWPNPISDLTLAEALDESVRTHKVLLLVPGGPPPPPHAAQGVWASPTLAAWVEWHAIVVVPRPSRDGEVLRRLGIDRLRPGISIITGGHLRKTLERDRGGSLNLHELLLGLDTFMLAQRTRDPVWLELHNLHNPQPPRPPEPEPVSMSDDGDAPRIFEPIDPGPDDVLARLDEARAYAAEGMIPEAVARYTWLWERADELDPAMRAARVQWLAAEMRELAREHPAAQRRFRALRDRMEDTMLWWTYDELIDYTVLNAVCNEVEHSIEFFDLYLNDPWEGAIVARTERGVYQQIADMPDWSAPDAASPAAVERLARFAERTARLHRPAADDPEMWKLAQALRRRLVVDEGCRLYAASLARGRDEAAARAAAIVLEHENTSAARHALVASALIAGQPRPVPQLAWLDEARSMGTDHPDLRARLLGGSDPTPVPPSAPPHTGRRLRPPPVSEPSAE